MKQILKKATKELAGHNTRTLTMPDKIPPHFSVNSGMSKGFWRLK